MARKTFDPDAGHWVTIDGNHVFIQETGTGSLRISARAGASAADNTGTKVSREDLVKRRDTLGKRMEEITGQSSMFMSLPAALREEYYKVQSERQRIMAKLTDMDIKEANEKHAAAAAGSSSHTFVNGYGEATKREISSATYDRSQKRLEKAIRRNMGWDNR